MEIKMNTAKVDGCNEVAFSMTRGISWSWIVTVTDARKKIQPLFNYTAKMDIRSAPVYPATQGTLLYSLNSVYTVGQGPILITPELGKIALNIPTVASLNFAEGCYIYALVITSPTSENYEILKGNFTVTSPVTNI